MKRFLLLMLVICFLFTGCASFLSKPEADAVSTEHISVENTSPTEASIPPVITEPEVVATTIYPLPDTTMENLRDAILSVSLKESGAYADETGKLHMEIEIYSYDKYDMVDISMMKVGDILATNAGEVALESLGQNADGSICVNGGLFENGFDLTTDDSGIYYECGYNDAKNWYKIGEIILSVSENFICYDSSDLEQGVIEFTSESFLNGDISNFDFTPYNTTIRVENGQIVEMNRMYTP